MPDTPVVAVRGEATRDVEPDLAVITASVSARSADRQRTLRLLTERLDALRALVDTYGPAVERRESGGVSVRPETSGKSAERVKGYLGLATTRVWVGDFTALGDIVVALSDLELTTVNGPVWLLRPENPAYREVRHEALRDAVDRARDYARAVGAELVELVELADAGLSGRSEPSPMAFAVSAQTYRGAAPELNLDPELQRVYASVEARFTMTRPDVAAL